MMPHIFRIFLSLTFPDKIVAISFIVLAAVICILQVILANKNKEIQRLRKITESLPITTPITTMTAKRLVEHSKKQTEYSQKGEGIDDNKD